MSNLIPIESAVPSTSGINDKAMDYISQAKADNTKKSYHTDWQDFIKYCENIDTEYLPATVVTIVNYLTQLVEHAKVSTITRRISAISQAHQTAGFTSPTHALPVRALMSGIRRAKGTAQEGKTPILVDDIKTMIAMLPDNLLGVRDKALLLLGFTGAFRRSELVSLNIEDLAFSRERLTVLLRKSKTDQDGQGTKKGIPYCLDSITCPVQAIQDWLNASGIVTGALFRAINRHGQLQPGRLSDKAVALIVKRSVEATGLNPNNYSGNSLRAGLATSAAMVGVEERVIMQQTGHKSVNMVRKYIRDGSLFRNNAVSHLGL
ncbi:Tyrosine recombinase XerC [bioreactor metagenome]|uniref:Tyrosine recombinase XerC n=1 Tax=bioreactor metagenome TaxID=1076179 RepID=A0A645CB95_9ZZZZ